MTRRLLVVAFLVWMLSEAKATHCPPQYHKLSPRHTFCLPRNTQCKLIKTGVSEDEKNEILKIHNDFRAELAKGQKPPLPPAANVMKMVWDDELASIAQAHANQCQFIHDCTKCRKLPRFLAGQNLYVSRTDSPDMDVSNWTTAIKLWLSEIKDFRPEYRKPFHFDSKVGHFSQSVWAQTTYVGCGRSTFTADDDEYNYSSLFVCNYGPMGNMRGGTMYEEGPVCSKCPPNSSCSNGLCSLHPGRASKIKGIPSRQYKWRQVSQRLGTEVRVQQIPSVVGILGRALPAVPDGAKTFKHIAFADCQCPAGYLVRIQGSVLDAAQEDLGTLTALLKEGCKCGETK